MANFFTTTIGKKILVSITGLFLILFLIEHLAVNMLIVFDDTGRMFNEAAYFLTNNPVIKIIEPVLFIGFIMHILITVMLSIQNLMQKDANHAGFSRYKTRISSAGSTWTSRNMLVLGIFLFAFLVIHLNHFFVKMKFTGDPLLEAVLYDGVAMKNSYALVVGTISECGWILAVYIIGAIAIGLHLHHGIWSAFQSLGFSNKKWRKILNVFGVLLAIAIGVGYAFIPLYVAIVL
jgi:succinate dehydrogenase / fumarate reductase, cytochrome b subunit